jgi:hypothetical protein
MQLTLLLRQSDGASDVMQIHPVQLQSFSGPGQWKKPLRLTGKESAEL